MTFGRKGAFGRKGSSKKKVLSFARTYTPEQYEALRNHSDQVVAARGQISRDLAAANRLHLQELGLTPPPKGRAASTAAPTTPAAAPEPAPAAAAPRRRSTQVDSESDYDDEASDSEFEDAPKSRKKKAPAAPRAAAAPKIAATKAAAKPAKATIKSTIIEIFSKKKKGCTCKELKKELKKRGFDTSDVYIRNTCKALGIELEKEQSRRALCLATPMGYFAL